MDNGSNNANGDAVNNPLDVSHIRNYLIASQWAKPLRSLSSASSMAVGNTAASSLSPSSSSLYRRRITAAISRLASRTPTLDENENDDDHDLRRHGRGNDALRSLEEIIHEALFEIENGLPASTTAASSSEDDEDDHHDADKSKRKKSRGSRQRIPFSWRDAFEVAIVLDVPTSPDAVVHWMDLLATGRECGGGGSENTRSAAATSSSYNGDTAAPPGVVDEEALFAVLSDEMKHHKAVRAFLKQMVLPLRSYIIGHTIEAVLSAAETEAAGVAAADDDDRTVMEAISERSDVAEGNAEKEVDSASIAEKDTAGATEQPPQQPPQQQKQKQLAPALPSLPSSSAPPPLLFVDEDDVVDALALELALALDESEDGDDGEEGNVKSKQEGREKKQKEMNRSTTPLTASDLGDSHRGGVDITTANSDGNGVGVVDAEEMKPVLAEVEQKKSSSLLPTSSYHPSLQQQASPPPPPRYALTRHAVEHATNLEEVYLIDAIVAKATQKYQHGDAVNTTKKEQKQKERTAAGKGLSSSHSPSSSVLGAGDLLLDFVNRRTAEARKQQQEEEKDEQKQRDVENKPIVTRYAQYHLTYFRAMQENNGSGSNNVDGRNPNRRKDGNGNVGWDDRQFIAALMPLARLRCPPPSPPSSSPSSLPSTTLPYHHDPFFDKRLTTMGLASAQYDIAMCFLALRDVREAMVWCALAAQQGHVKAMLSLAQMHLAAAFEGGRVGGGGGKGGTTAKGKGGSKEEDETRKGGERRGEGSAGSSSKSSLAARLAFSHQAHLGDGEKERRTDGSKEPPSSSSPSPSSSVANLNQIAGRLTTFGDSDEEEEEQLLRIVAQTMVEAAEEKALRKLRKKQAKQLEKLNSKRRNQRGVSLSSSSACIDDLNAEALAKQLNERFNSSKHRGASSSSSPSHRDHSNNDETKKKVEGQKKPTTTTTQQHRKPLRKFIFKRSLGGRSDQNENDGDGGSDSDSSSPSSPPLSETDEDKNFEKTLQRVLGEPTDKKKKTRRVAFDDEEKRGGEEGNDDNEDTTIAAIPTGDGHSERVRLPPPPPPLVDPLTQRKLVWALADGIREKKKAMLRGERGGGWRRGGGGGAGQRQQKKKNGQSIGDGGGGAPPSLGEQFLYWFHSAYFLVLYDVLIDTFAVMFVAPVVRVLYRWLCAFFLLAPLHAIVCRPLLSLASWLNIYRSPSSSIPLLTSPAQLVRVYNELKANLTTTSGHHHAVDGGGVSAEETEKAAGRAASRGGPKSRHHDNAHHPHNTRDTEEGGDHDNNDDAIEDDGSDNFISTAITVTTRTIIKPLSNSLSSLYENTIHIVKRMSEGHALDDDDAIAQRNGLVALMRAHDIKTKAMELEMQLKSKGKGGEGADGSRIAADAGEGAQLLLLQAQQKDLRQIEKLKYRKTSDNNANEAPSPSSEEEQKRKRKAVASEKVLLLRRRRQQRRLLREEKLKLILSTFHRRVSERIAEEKNKKQHVDAGVKDKAGASIHQKRHDLLPSSFTANDGVSTVASITVEICADHGGITHTYPLLLLVRQQQHQEEEKELLAATTITAAATEDKDGGGVNTDNLSPHFLLPLPAAAATITAAASLPCEIRRHFPNKSNRRRFITSPSSSSSLRNMFFPPPSSSSTDAIIGGDANKEEDRRGEGIFAKRSSSWFSAESSDSGADSGRGAGCGADILTRYHIRKCLSLLQYAMAAAEDWDAETAKHDRATAAALLSMLEEEAMLSVKAAAVASARRQSMCVKLFGALIALFTCCLVLLVAELYLEEDLGDDDDYNDDIGSASLVYAYGDGDEVDESGGIVELLGLHKFRLTRIVSSLVSGGEGNGVKGEGDATSARRFAASSSTSPLSSSSFSGPATGAGKPSPTRSPLRRLLRKRQRGGGSSSSSSSSSSFSNLNTPATINDAFVNPYSGVGGEGHERDSREAEEKKLKKKKKRKSRDKIRGKEENREENEEQPFSTHAIHQKDGLSYRFRKRQQKDK